MPKLEWVHFTSDGSVIRGKRGNGNPAELVPRPLPLDQLVPTMEDLIEGRIIDWSETDVVPKTVKLMFNEKGWRFMGSIITSLPNKEAEQALNLFTSDLACSFPDISLLQSSSLRERICKLTLGLYIFEGIEVAAKTSDKPVLAEYPAVKKFCEVVGEQVERWAKTLKSLTKEDLTACISFRDVSDEGTDVEIGSGKRPNHQLSQGDITRLTSETTRLNEKLKQTDQEAWQRIRVGWGWGQIQAVLSSLPNLRSQRVISHCITALESNLIGLQDKKPLQELKFDPKAIKILLGFLWREQKINLREELEEMYPEVLRQLDIPPKEYLPSVATKLLAQVANVQGTDFPKLLRDIHEEVKDEKGLVSSWLSTLLVLRQEQSRAGLINEILSGWEEIPERTRRILLDQEPGRLVLSPKGKLRVVDSNANPGLAFTLYTSLVQPEQKEEPVLTVREKAKELSPRFEVDEAVILPFFGEVGGISGTDSQNLIRSLANGKSLDEGNLFGDFADLAEKWKERTPEKTLLYLYNLNRSTPFMKRAKQLGIEAIVIQGKGAFFILEKEKGQAILGERTLQLMIEGDLDEEGQLSIKRTDSSFIGELEQLFLNNLALYCATRKVSSGVSLNEQDLKRKVHELVSSWNHSSKRGPLPKIGTTEDNNQYQYIVVSPDGDNFFLVGEISK